MEVNDMFPKEAAREGHACIHVAKATSVGSARRTQSATKQFKTGIRVGQGGRSYYSPVSSGISETGNRTVSIRPIESLVRLDPRTYLFFNLSEYSLAQVEVKPSSLR